MNALLLAFAVLTGPPCPEHQLFVGVNSHTPDGRNARADIGSDALINAQFVVTFVERDERTVEWRTSRYGQWMKWPELKYAPNGVWCTPGFGTGILKHELRKHISEIEYHNPNGFVWEQDPPIQAPDDSLPWRDTP